MIVVTGATGHVGGELVRQLAERGEAARAVVRKPDAVLPEGVELAVGDLSRPDSLREAFAGADALFLLAGYPEAVLDEARAAGITRVALLSGGSAVIEESDNAVSEYMIATEKAVRASGLAWTFLRPAGFMSNTLEWVPQLAAGDVVRAPFAGVPIAVIDPADIAAVALEALTSDAHAGVGYALSGPDPLVPADRLRILGEVLGRDLRFVAEPDEEAWERMTAIMPERYVRAFFSFYVDGTLDESVVHPTVAEVTGRSPRTFEQWATAHADAFRGEQG
ncbi:NAD(P)H-binding protein [Pseudonocardia sp. TRM90224]|uniref:NAD(P)H-binding protein n=1 Tax=Pseudonocardia sp. TRM90224 TaxID=2812678 RepID=UPI001E426389|nr:NAD(P)H-binding protein [Pseudonocardia sp. TRM90224]